MELRKIDLLNASWAEKRKILVIDRSSVRTCPDPTHFFRRMANYDCYGYFEGGQMAGFILMEPKCAYFGGCTRVEKLKYAWEFNRPDTITEMLRLAAAQYAVPFVCMDVDRKHDVNRELYEKIGFSDSAMTSPKGKNYSVMIAERQKLIDGRK